MAAGTRRWIWRPRHIHVERTGTMHITRNIGMLLLAILLIAWGLVQLLGLGALNPVLAILAIAAGIFILLGR
jgi:hypothetical protein